MCLYYSSEKTEEFRKRFRKPIVCYKRYYYDPETKKLEPPYFGSPFKLSRSGIVRSNRKQVECTYYEQLFGEVHKGIHVARQLSYFDFYERKEYLILKVICHPKDFVGTNYHQSELVFMKVKIDVAYARKTIKKYESSRKVSSR